MARSADRIGAAPGRRPSPVAPNDFTSCRCDLRQHLAAHRETAQPLTTVYGVALQLDHRLREIGCNRHDHAPWPDHALPQYADLRSSERLCLDYARGGAAGEV
ncbi:MAG: hypothetical protein R2911_44845 [Caldilineaceae bacterium]